MLQNQRICLGNVDIKILYINLQDLQMKKYPLSDDNQLMSRFRYSINQKLHHSHSTYIYKTHTPGRVHTL